MAQDDLIRYRETITQIDEEMARLFERRMDVSGRIAGYKKERGLAIKDTGREETLIRNNLSHITNPDYEEYYVDFLKGILDISCRYQEKIISG